MSRELKILETNLKSKDIIKFYLVFFADFSASVLKTAMFCPDFPYFSYAVFDWGSTKMHLFSESRFAKVLAVERDVKLRSMNFAKVERRGGWLIGRGHLYR